MENLVIIPTYNEKENIAPIIQAIFSLDEKFDVLIVDDNSPDGTAQLVEQLQLLFPLQLFLEKRTGKLGLGSAYIYGFKWALSKGYQYIIEMDADFSHRPIDLQKLYRACIDQQADLAVGSRYVQEGKILNWPVDRHIYSKGGALYTRIITQIPIKDPTAGFICYHRKVLETIDLNEIEFSGYAFQIEMKFIAWKMGFKIIEVPIIFVDRVAGVSKITKNIILEGVFGVVKIQFKSLFKKHYLRKRTVAV